MISEIVNKSIVCVSSNPKINAQSLPDDILTLTATHLSVTLNQFIFGSFKWSCLRPTKNEYPLNRVPAYLGNWLNKACNLYWASKFLIEVLDEYKYRFDKGHPSERVRALTLSYIKDIETSYSRKEIRSKSALPHDKIPSRFWRTHNNKRVVKGNEAQKINLVRTNIALLKSCTNLNFTKRDKPPWLREDSIRIYQSPINWSNYATYPTN